MGYDTQHLMTHAAAGRIGHLGILDVIARIGEEIVIARVIPMHMRRDDVVDLIRCNTKRL